jgi:hypothetical protein
MEDLVLTLPTMWADHHVLAVRDALRDAPGVADVVASSLDKTLHLTLDPAVTTVGAVNDLLTAAGYPAGDAPEAGEALKNKPAWAQLGRRVTATDPVDLSMSGDYRRY